MEIVAVWCMSLYGHSGAGDSAERTRQNEKLLRDTFLFLAGLGAVLIMILADLNISPHLSLAVRSAIDVAGWADTAVVVAEASALEPAATCFVHAGPGSRIDAVLANRIAKHLLCDVGLVGSSGIPTHEPVAAVFQLAECEQTATTIARLKEIDLTFRDRVVSHILKKQNDEWTKAKQQHDVQRLWMLWCEGAQAYLCERSQQVPGNQNNAQCGRGQVRLKTQEKSNYSHCS